MGFTREISCCNTDKALIDCVAGFFRDLNFSISVYFRQRQFPEKNQWTVRLSARKSTFEQFRDLIPIQSPRKKTVLDDIINSYRDTVAMMETRRKGRELTCASCSAKFYRPPSQEAQFCSNDCAKEATKRRTSKVCETCGTHYEVTLARKKSRYCSLSCAGKAQKERLSTLGKATIANARAHIKQRKSVG